MSRIGKSKERESRLVVVRGWGGEGAGTDKFSSTLPGSSGWSKN